MITVVLEGEREMGYRANRYWSSFSVLLVGTPDLVKIRAEWMKRLLKE